jgi:hypothetical protein
MKAAGTMTLVANPTQAYGGNTFVTGTGFLSVSSTQSRSSPNSVSPSAINTSPALGKSSLNIAGSTPFTLETSFWWNSNPQVFGTLIGGFDSVFGIVVFRFQLLTDGTLQATYNNTVGGSGTFSAGIMPIQTWCDLAICRDSVGTMYFFANGNLVQTVGGMNQIFPACMYMAPAPVRTSANASFMDEMRITLGVCRYITSYTPSFPFPTQ